MYNFEFGQFLVWRYEIMYCKGMKLYSIINLISFIQFRFWHVKRKAECLKQYFFGIGSLYIVKLLVLVFNWFAKSWPVWHNSFLSSLQIVVLCDTFEISIFLKSFEFFQKDFEIKHLNILSHFLLYYLLYDNCFILFYSQNQKAFQNLWSELSFIKINGFH